MTAKGKSTGVTAKAKMADEPSMDELYDRRWCEPGEHNVPSAEIVGHLANGEGYCAEHDPNQQQQAPAGAADDDDPCIVCGRNCPSGLDDDRDDSEDADYCVICNRSLHTGCGICCSDCSSVMCPTCATGRTTCPDCTTPDGTTSDQQQQAPAGGAAEDAKRITKGQTHSSLICVDALGDYWY